MTVFSLSSIHFQFSSVQPVKVWFGLSICRRTDDMFHQQTNSQQKLMNEDSLGMFSYFKSVQNQSKSYKPGKISSISAARWHYIKLDCYWSSAEATALSLAGTEVPCPIRQCLFFGSHQFHRGLQA